MRVCERCGSEVGRDGFTEGIVTVKGPTKFEYWSFAAVKVMLIEDTTGHNGLPDFCAECVKVLLRDCIG